MVDLGSNISILIQQQQRRPVLDKAEEHFHPSVNTPDPYNLGH